MNLTDKMARKISWTHSYIPRESRDREIPRQIVCHKDKKAANGVICTFLGSDRSANLWLYS